MNRKDTHLQQHQYQEMNDGESPGILIRASPPTVSQPPHISQLTERCEIENTELPDTTLRSSPSPLHKSLHILETTAPSRYPAPLAARPAIHSAVLRHGLRATPRHPSPNFVHTYAPTPPASRRWDRFSWIGSFVTVLDERGLRW